MRLIANILKAPFLLPEHIASKITPRVDVMLSDKSLDRRISLGGAGEAVFGACAVLTCLAGVMFGGAFAVGAAGAAILLPAAAGIGISFTSATIAAACSKIRIESIVIKAMNEVIKQNRAKAQAVEIETPAAPAPQVSTPDFNHAAATTLDKDIQVMPAIKIARRGVSP